MAAYWLPLAAVLGLLYGLLYLVAGAVYRLFFHPLANFPPPKLAALTQWYEAYYDVVKKGHYIFEVGKMHEKYGPILRIGPNELHILDPTYYDTLYSQSHRLDKYDFYRMLGNLHTLFNTISSPLSPFFSAQAISRISPTTQHLTGRLCARLAASAANDEPVPLYRRLTVAIIPSYVFGSQLSVLERRDWGRLRHHGRRAGAAAVDDGPPAALEIVDLSAAVDEATLRLLRSEPEAVAKKTHPVVIWELRKSPTLPEQEKSFRRLSFEANGLLSAGLRDDGRGAGATAYYVLAHLAAQRRLVGELEEAILDPGEIPGWLVLEKLLFLPRVVKEGLRRVVSLLFALPPFPLPFPPPPLPRLAPPPLHNTNPQTPPLHSLSTGAIPLSPA